MAKKKAYGGYQRGFYTQMPHHLQHRLADEGLEACAILYGFFYDGVGSEDSIHKHNTYKCETHGEFVLTGLESNEEGSWQPNDTMPCPAMKEGVSLLHTSDKNATCNKPSAYISSKIEGLCFFGEDLSIAVIAAKTHSNYDRTQYRANLLAEAGFIRREQDPDSLKYYWWVLDTFKFTEAGRLEAMRSNQNPVGDEIGRRRKNGKAKEACPDCGEKVVHDDLAKHACWQKRERVSKEVLATLKPDVQTFYQWVAESGGVPEPDKDDNDRLQILINITPGETDGKRRQSLMIALKHLLFEGFWSERGGANNRTGINCLQFVQSEWKRMYSTYEQEDREKKKEIKRKQELKNATPVEKERMAKIEREQRAQATKMAAAEIQARIDEECDGDPTRSDEENGVPPAGYNPYDEEFGGLSEVE